MKKTKKLMSAVLSGVMVTSTAACGNAQTDLPPVPDTDECRDWDWDDELGVWECDDERSRYYGGFFYGSKFFKTKSALTSSSAYKSYKSSPSFKGGFSSGSKGGFGG
ncbi:hypothetical protein LCL95_00195 [Bacillus timonensis]|nr:hypothetical protein [Bacillus timonensis]